MISRMSPTPVRLAASISSTSTCRPSAIARQASQTPQGSIVGPPAPSAPGAVQPLGDDPRRRGLADPAHAGQHEGVRDPLRLEGVAERAHHRLLPDQVGEGRGPVLAGQNPIGGLGQAAFRWRWGRMPQPMRRTREEQGRAAVRAGAARAAAPARPGYRPSWQARRAAMAGSASSSGTITRRSSP